MSGQEQEKVELVNGRVFIQLYVEDSEVVDWLAKVSDSDNGRVDAIKRALKIGVTAITSAWASTISLTFDQALSKTCQRFEHALDQWENRTTERVKGVVDQTLSVKVPWMMGRLEGTEKGKAFEIAVGELMQIATNTTGDRLEHVGTGHEKGDWVIHVTHSESNARAEIGKIVVEAKNAEGISKSRAFEYLDGAIRCREADVGILVFAKRNQNPWELPFQALDKDGTMYVCQWDEHGLALTIAYQLARSEILRKYSSPSVHLDWESFHNQIAQVIREAAQIDDILHELESGIEKAHTALQRCKQRKRELVLKLDMLAMEIAGRVQG